MEVRDQISGLFLAGLGMAAWYGGSLLPPVPGQQVGPNVFPMVVGGGLVVCGLLIALGIGSSIEKEAEADMAAHTDPAIQLAPRDQPFMFAAKTLLPPALLIFYVFVVERLGFVPTAAIMVLLTAIAMGSRLKIALFLALAAPPAVHLIFSKLLRVPLPTGLVPLPW